MTYGSAEDRIPLPAAEARTLLARGEAPAGLRVEGTLDYTGEGVPPLPERMTVDRLDLTRTRIETLPAGLVAYELRLSETPIRSLPADLAVRSRLDLVRCEELEELPPGLTVGTLDLRGCTALRRLPEGLDVWFLDLSGCWALESWPESARIRGGRLQLRGCTAMRTLPPYLRRLSALNLRDCPNITSLPADLVVTGWLDVAHSGLTDEAALPPGLADTQLRWAGLNVDRRIAFHPDRMEVGEVLGERNAERRRVLLDRYGYGRFLNDAGATLLNADRDPGGARQLLRVDLPGDEPLVALSCFCPSTGRQYMIRVPPRTETCHQAAAWIAGFENADDYQPVQET